MNQQPKTIKLSKVLTPSEKMVYLGVIGAGYSQIENQGKVGDFDNLH